MRRLLPSLLSFSLLAGCTTNAGQQYTLEDRLRNPLYAEWYYEELTDHMVNLSLDQDPILEDEEKKEMVDRIRRESLKKANETENVQMEGMHGRFVSDRGLAQGEALLLGNSLYIGPDFQTIASPNLHVYLSKMLDPREGAQPADETGSGTAVETFPGASAIDLGMIMDLYGAQEYGASLPEQAEGEIPYRTVVLWDEDMERVIGFAQLSVQN